MASETTISAATAAVAHATTTTTTQKRRLFDLPDTLLAHVLSFGDVSDHIAVLRASQMAFSNALGVYLADAPSLSLSFLLRMYPNALHDNGQHEVAVQILMSLLINLSQQRKEKALKHLELSNLRGTTGRSGWFSQLSSFPIVTLDLSNNVQFDETLLLTFLRDGPAPTTLRYLHLTGCCRVTPDILQPLQTERHSQLLSLSIGSCSQTIGDDFVLPMLRNLRRLQHLNLQNLQNLGRLSDDSFVDELPDSLKSLNISGCSHLCLYSQDLMGYFEHLCRPAPPGATEEYRWEDPPASRLRLESLIVNDVGTKSLIGRRRGIIVMALSLFSSGLCLREVHLSGCEEVDDFEIRGLAYNCRHTLTCFQLRGGRIGEDAMKWLARYCEVLAEVDVSGCMGIDDKAISCLCQPKSETVSNSDTLAASRKRKIVSTFLSLKVLRVAGIAQLTNNSLESISKLDSLLILDIHDCPGLTTNATHTAMKTLPHLVEVNAKNIARGTRTLTSLLRNDPTISKSLRFVNERVFTAVTQDVNVRGCCSVRTQSQRLKSTIPLQSMYHCVDCNLVPSLDRGVCAECVQKCHKGHKTFVGSYTRFYCDCPFGVATPNICRALEASRREGDVAGEGPNKDGEVEGMTSLEAGSIQR